MTKTSERCDVTTMHRVEGVTKAKTIELCNVHPKSRVPNKRTKNTNLHLLTSNLVTIAFFFKTMQRSEVPRMATIAGKKVVKNLCYGFCYKSLAHISLQVLCLN